jgi:peptidoglycan/xylan/chitin deacetylase (PgdA/CDA1 family)
MAMMGRKWQRAMRIVKRAMVPHALILMYHRVADLDSDPHLLAVTPGHFAAHLDVIREHGHPLTLNDLVKGLERGRVPRRAVAVTFDDGYADNLHVAKPLLERLEVPATVFVAAGLVGGQREFWWDELDRLLLQPGMVPPRLRLDLDGKVREWELKGAASYSSKEYRRNRQWNIEQNEFPSVRHRIFMDLFSWMLEADPAYKELLLVDLRDWAGADHAPRPTQRPVTEKELVLLSESSLIEIGAHTLNHPALGVLSPEDQRTEIVESKRRLESMLEVPVISFALPHGSSNANTAEILRQAGFGSVCTSHPDAVWAKTDPMSLPRLGVRDMDGDSFEAWFRWWMDG